MPEVIQETECKLICPVSVIDDNQIAFRRRRKLIDISISANSSTVSREPVRRWGIGIQGGYGMGLSNGQVKAFSYIGVGISWDFIRF